jgi:GT2 family glycosyltransferase
MNMNKLKNKSPQFIVNSSQNIQNRIFNDLDLIADILLSQFSDIKAIVLAGGFGRGEGFNVGIANSIGSILIFLDNDAFFEDDGITKIVDRFNKYPDLWIIDPRIYNYFSKEIQNEPKNWPLQDRMFTGCAVGIKKEVIDNKGRRPKNYFIYASEPDVCIRALDFGYKIEHFNDIVAYHKESPVNRFSSKFYY